MTDINASSIAILIPCYNESKTIQKVIHDFQHHLPQANIYVYDNGSVDNSQALAIEAGALVNDVAPRGKGNVIRSMFADIDADIYVMVDGDATYDASAALPAIQLLKKKNRDMVVCVRKPTDQHSFPLGHQFGNAWFTSTVNFLFGCQLHDIFSGYRIFSNRFVKSFPAISQGFEIEAEMTIHSLQLGLPIAEMDAPYVERPSGSHSKLNTFKDGFRILKTVFLLFVYVKPMIVYGVLFLLLLAASLVLGLPVTADFFHTGLVPRLPTALLAASLGLLASLCLACGIVLDSMSRARLETKKLWYLSQ